VGVPTQDEKAERFRALHEGDAFIIPNPWDAGSAKVFAALGFQALATTSSGFAFTLGRADGNATLDEVVAHVRVLGAATDLPISVDLENGYGPDPRDAANAIARAAEAGAVGGSIEDYDPSGRLYDLDQATERVAAAVGTARGLGFPFMLTARAENHIRGNPDIDDTIARLQAYERAGADVLYAPGLRNGDEIRAVCSAVGKPVNVLAHKGLTIGEIVDAGGARISVGGALTWVAVNAMAAAAKRIRDEGDFSVLAGAGQIPEATTSSGREYTARHHSSASTRIDSVASPRPRTSSRTMWFSTIASSACAEIRAEMSAGAMPCSWSRAIRASARSANRVMNGAHSSGRCSPRWPESWAASRRTRAWRLTTVTTRPRPARSSLRGSPSPSR
jgi:2-methylisocitrate lyase-like PEP mutase family enzyme